MKAYKFIKLIGSPDVGDIQSEGRRSAIGRLRRGEVRSYYKDNIVRYADGTPGRLIERVVHNDRGYCSPRRKAAVRRYLKRVNRVLDLKFALEN